MSYKYSCLTGPGQGLRQTGLIRGQLPIPGLQLAQSRFQYHPLTRLRV